MLLNKMKYLLDTNTLISKLSETTKGRNNLCVIHDVAREYEFPRKAKGLIQRSGIDVIELSRKHYAKLTTVLSVHADNLGLINLYEGTGAADVMMLAFVLSERDNPAGLFPVSYTLVTKDKELTKIAQLYSISCTQNLN